MALSNKGKHGFQSLDNLHSIVKTFIFVFYNTYKNINIIEMYLVILQLACTWLVPGFGW